MSEYIDNITDQAITDDEMLMAYFRNQLSAADEAALTARLKSDSDFKTRAVAIARLIKGLENEGVARDKEIIESAKQKPKTIKLWVKIAAAAAIFVGVIFGINLYENNRLDNLAAEYETAFSSSDFVRGDLDGNIQIKLNNLFNNVLQSAQLDATIAELEKYWQQSLSENYNDLTNYMPQIGWHLAVAHLKKHDKSASHQTLKTLIDNTEEGSAVQEKSEELSERL